MHTSNPPAVSASNLLRELHSGSRDASSFTPDERRAVVEHLTLEGYSITEQRVGWAESAKPTDSPGPPASVAHE